MHARNQSTRRDERFLLPQDRSGVEVSVGGPEPSSLFGTLTMVSISGIAFRMEGDSTLFQPDTCLERIVLGIGRVTFSGTAIILNSRELHEEEMEFGCLFHPCPEDEDRWQGFLAGIEVGNLSHRAATV